MKRTLHLSVVFCLALWVVSTFAHAERVGVVVTGEATMQPQLVTQLEGWLKKHGHELVPAPLTPDAINTLIDCFVIEDEGCARGVIEKRAKSNAVVYARVDIQAGGDLEKTVTVLAYWFEKGQPAVAERRFCQRCNDETLRATADEVITALAKAGHKKGNGKLKITANRAAKVSIDGKSVGETPLETDVIAGPHEVTITAGNDTQTQTIEVRAGETVPVDAKLATPRGRTLPIVAMSVGGAMVAAGIVMIAVDEDRLPSEPPEINNTAPGGVALAIAGVAVAAGGYVWFRMSGQRESAPVATVTPGGAYVGWAGRF